MSAEDWDHGCKQSILASIAEIKKQALISGANDLVRRLTKEGAQANKIKISSDKSTIEMITSTDAEYAAGKTYFDTVVDNLPEAWPEGK